MIVPLALKILGAVSGTALLATTTLIVLPVVTPAIFQTVWLDAPADGSTLEAGQFTLTVHSTIPNTTRLTVAVTRTGGDTQKLSSQSVERTSRGANAVALATADLLWTATPGEYRLRLGACVGSNCSQAGVAHITIVEQSPVIVYEATAGPQPGETDEPEPGPTDEPSEEPVDPDPIDDPDPQPDPTPSGSIAQNFTDGAKIQTWFDVSGIAPAGTKVSVRVQVVPAGAGYDDSSWTTLACPVSGTGCSTGIFDAGLGGGQQRWGYYQVVLKNGSNVVYGDVEFWEMVR